MTTTNPRRMTKRSRNGAGSRQFHAVPAGQDPSMYRPAVCGARPAAPGAFSPDKKHVPMTGGRGWGLATGKHVTCRKCLAALAQKKAA